LSKQKQNPGCLPLIGAVAVALFSIPFGFYLIVYLLARRSGRLPQWVQKRIDACYYPTHITPEHAKRVPELVEALGRQARILDIGTSGAFDQLAPNTIGVNLVRNPLTDVIADAHILPFADASFDAVFCFGVFEHLARPWVVTAEIERVLKPGGTFYMEVPFLVPYHPDPSDYYRYTIPGLRSLFSRFEELAAGVGYGPGSMLTWLLAEVVATIADIDGNFDSSATHIAPARYMRAKEAGRLLFGPLKYLDRLLLRKEHSYVVASGIYYHGIKPLPGLPQ